MSITENVKKHHRSGRESIQAGVARVKDHVVENKRAYITAGAVVVVAGVAYYVGKNVGQTAALKAPAEVVTASNEFVGDVVVNNAPSMINKVCWKPTLNNIINFAEDSTPSRPVAMVDENGMIIAAWKSMSKAAKETGHHLRDISKNVNGQIDNIKGDRFVSISDLAETAA